MNIIKTCKEKIFRRKKIKNGFFEKIIFQQKDEKLQNSILTWIYQLQEGGICISKFSNLWKGFDDIAFPISVEQWYCGVLYIEIDMKDSKGIDWNMIIDRWSMSKYEIGRETQEFSIYQKYEATKNENIVIGKQIIPKNVDKENNFEICFKYDRQIEATMQKGKKELKIIYNKNEYEELIFKYLIKQTSVELTNDVFQNFVNLVQKLKESGEKEPYSIAISIKNDEIIMSEVNMKNGTVTEYSFTKIANGNMRGFCKMYFEKEMEDFLNCK